MDMRLAENIRLFRKARSLTQEQLAEAMRVTVGAVSKWEAGLNTPDISLIMELADFFETSVDVLLGYEWRSRGMGRAVDLIKDLYHQKRFEEGVAEVDKALHKFPNCFEVVYQSAIFMDVMGIERKDEHASRRALVLYEHAIELIEQNTDDSIGEMSIRRHIANVLLALGSTEQALEQLKKTNFDGCNNDTIGHTLACVCKKPEEALTYLSRALVNHITRLVHTAIAYANAYKDLHDERAALEMLDWIHGVIGGLKKQGGVCFLDKTDAYLMSAYAQISASLGDIDRAREYLHSAYKLAERFDASPSDKVSSIRFYYGDDSATVYDDMGESVVNGIKETFMDDDTPTELLLRLWDEAVNNERN